MTLRKKLQRETVLLDGAFGTYVQSFGIKESDFKGKTGCMEYLSITRPDIIHRVHEDYFDAGSDAVETNTFGANAVKLSEYGLSKDVFKINKASTSIARDSADRFSSSGHSRYVVGAMGPTGKLPSSTDPILGDITYTELKRIFRDQASGIIAGGADAILVETGSDLLEMKAALTGAKEAAADFGKAPVIMAQCTLVDNGRMLLGTEISAVMTIFYSLGADVIGLNCGAGPLAMEEEVRYLAGNCPAFISCVPNAGLPIATRGKTSYPMGPDEMAAIMARFVNEYGVNVIGGCCGTTPGHIRAMRGEIDKSSERRGKTSDRMDLIRRGKDRVFCASSYKGFDLAALPRPVEVAERLNAQGSRKMKELLISEDYDGIIELGKEEEAMGASLLDVCGAITERDTEARDETMLVKRLAESVSIPLMIDSVDVNVIREALCNYPGTAFINSVNLENGPARAGKVFALAKEHGSFVVCLAIDPLGMAIDVKHKMKIARELYSLATCEYALAPRQLLFDMLTFSLGTGDEKYASSAAFTLNAIEQVKGEMPGVLTILGVSNISFGLQKEGRRILNASFLHHAVRSGLDMAIVNPRQGSRYIDIPDEEQMLADDLIYNRGNGALTAFVEYFSGKSVKKKKAVTVPGTKKTSIEDRLKECVIDRDKAEIIPLIDEALTLYKAEAIANGILLEAMKEVGDKLESGEFVLPYVLQAAEVTRKAMEYLGETLSKEGSRAKGKVLLATVLGDVHDIGKNLVKMILQNNGYLVIDLGKQVPAEKIALLARKNKVDAIGLSALLVGTARYMASCVQAVHDAGLDCPVLIGGAPTNANFAEEISILNDKRIYKGGVFYTSDAFSALKILQSLKSGGKTAEHRPRGKEKRRSTKGACVKVTKKFSAGKAKTRGKVPEPPFYGVKTVLDIPAEDIFDLIDKKTLFNAGWGTGLKDKKKKRELIETQYKPLLESLKTESVQEKWLEFKAVYGYFKCRINGRDMSVLGANENVVEVIRFRDAAATNSLAGYFRQETEGYDVVAFLAATVGGKVGDKIDQLSDEQEYSKTFFVHGLSVYLAEALTEYMHNRIRGELRIKKGQGKRYSPGYPAWKNLEDQKKVFKILDVEKAIGVKLTESFQMVPEQSTTAMIVHSELAE
ncbi:MAG: homocysteine S-methyltransferase family protein [Candidatus Omnitrophica bacterium]|nr:homocysteine S-methyltransferase family protein [Candidatus Omnitrophota bacterium]MBU1784155.1 homocysteine S-methyltransferase family protein [Candidatus Omnitrophota bacterium]